MAPRAAIPFSLLLLAVFVSRSWGHNETCATPLQLSSSDLLDEVVAKHNTLGYSNLHSITSRKAKEEAEDACTLGVAKMINRDGQVVSPSARGAKAAIAAKGRGLLDSSCPGFGLCLDISDGGNEAWPLSTLTYIIVPTNATDQEEGCDKMKTLQEYVKWVLEDRAASAIAEEYSLATMPTIKAQYAMSVLDEMQCTDDVHGVHRVKDRLTRSNSLEGSGSSLQAGVQTRLTNEYFQQNFVSISYTASSSGSGMAALRAYAYDFAGSDAVLDMQDPEFIRRGMKMVPIFAAAVGVVFNLDQVDDLILSRSVLDRLFTGDAFSWRDHALLADNPAVAHLLPDEAVIRVVRSSSSGTTAALTTALHSFAGLPPPSGQDYSAHVLGGSSQPEWPTHPQPYPGATECKLKVCLDAVCEPGHYVDAAAQACLPCPLGSFSAVRGQHRACEACPAGSYTNTVGNSKCVRCHDQKFQDQAGQQACKTCPLNSRRFSTEVLRDGVLVRERTPGVSAAECMCVEGYWRSATADSSADCLQCPDGATCPGFPELIPKPKHGFWGREEHPHKMFECALDACQGDFQCIDGHSGRKCAAPVDGYFTIGELWFFQCPAPGLRPVMTIFGVLCVVAVWVLLHHLSLKYDAFAIAFLFFQIIGIISKFRLRWHPNLNFVLIALRIINFDVDFFGPHCMLPGWDAASAFYSQLLLPFLVVAFYAVFFLARKRFRNRGGEQDTQENQVVIENKNYLRSPAYNSDDLGTYLFVKGLSYLIMMFHTLAARAFSVFVCETDADGEREFLVSAPTLQCWTRAHVGMAAFASLYILTVICGAPVVLLWKMRRMQREDRLCDFTITVSYWFVFAKFKVAFPYWELVLLARRFALVLILVFVPVSMLQAALAIACLNAFLFVHLSYQPFKDKRVGLLDSFGLCCSMAYAVCGMLFFPSLDNTLECVGSANLDAIGIQCRRNQELKEETSVALLLLLLATLVAALYISFRDVQEKLFSAAAAKKIEADKKWYGKDKLFKALSTMPKDKCRADRIASLCHALSADDDANTQTLSGQTSALVGRVQDVTEGDPAKARRTVEVLQSLRAAKSMRNVEGHDFAHPAKLNLCDMLVGDCLNHWHRALSSLSDKELALRLVYAEEGERQSMLQELAYIDLELWVPAFAVRHERVNGYFSNNELARVLRELVEGMPELVNFLAGAEDGVVESFSNFVHSFAVFAQTRRTTAYHGLIVPMHRGQVVHWLMQCSAEEQRHFVALFRTLHRDDAPARSSSLSLGRVASSLSTASAGSKIHPDSKSAEESVTTGP